MCVNAIRRRGVEPPQNTVQVIGSAPLHPLAQTIAQLFRALRSCKKTFEQRPQIKPRPPTDNGQVLAFGDLLHTLTRLPGVFSRAHIAQWIATIEQMMRRLREPAPR